MKRGLTLIVLQTILLLCTQPLCSWAESSKKVLLLNSYHVGFRWTDDITTSIKKELQKSKDIDLRVEYLDTKRFYSPLFFHFQSESLAYKYKGVIFDAIICSDNNALNFLINNRHKTFPNTPIVFCGINYFTKDILQGETNITGINEAVDIRKNIDLILSAHPKTERIITVMDDSVTGKVLSEELIQISAEYPHIQWKPLKDYSFQQLQEYLSTLGPKDVVLLGLYVRDSLGEFFEFDEVSAQVSAHSSRPVYALWDFYLGNGVVGGYLASGTFQGIKAAELVQKILNGERADDIPVVIDSPNRYLADYTAMERFSLDVDQFPKETIFYNQPPDFYNEHKIEIWIFTVLFALLCCLSLFLSINIVRKRIAEKALMLLKNDLEQRVITRTEELSNANLEITEREEQMRNLLTNLSSMIYRYQYNKNWELTFVSHGAVALTGYSEDELLQKGEFIHSDLIDERDRQLVKYSIDEAISNKEQFTLEYRIHTKDKQKKWVWEQGMVLYDSAGAPLFLDGKVFDITQKKEIEQEQKKLVTVIQQTDDLVIITDLTGKIEYVNPAFERVTGYMIGEVIEENARILKSDKQASGFFEKMWQILRAGQVWSGQLTNKRKDGTEYIAEMSISPIRDQDGEIKNYVAIQRDITEKLVLENNLKQAQKLEAIGTMAGGIAHEINTPAQFVGSNITFIKETSEDLFDLINSYQQMISKVRDNSLSDSDFTDIEQQQSEVDLEYCKDEIPTALEQSQEGIERITKIVLAMKEFSHPSTKEKSSNSINRLIENTVTIASNEWKHVAKLELDLDPDIPMVDCFASEMSQVFLNIIVNAAHAIADKESDVSKELIKISSTYSDDWVVITIADSGGGIPESAQDHIFEPFFTTKSVGKGTGQGLSIAYDIVTTKHDGKISFETEDTKGTVFTLQLPL